MMKYNGSSAVERSIALAMLATAASRSFRQSKNRPLPKPYRSAAPSTLSACVFSHSGSVKGGIPPRAVTASFLADNHRDAVFASRCLKSLKGTLCDRALGKSDDVGSFRTGPDDHRLQIGDIAGHLRDGEGNVRCRTLARRQRRSLDPLAAVQFLSRLPEGAKHRMARAGLRLGARRPADVEFSDHDRFRVLLGCRRDPAVGCDDGAVTMS